jgi:hypothetical protein
MLLDGINLELTKFQTPLITTKTVDAISVIKLNPIQNRMDDSSYRRNFGLDKKNETITIAGKSILK